MDTQLTNCQPAGLEGPSTPLEGPSPRAIHSPAGPDWLHMQSHNVALGAYPPPQVMLAAQQGQRVPDQQLIFSATLHFQPIALDVAGGGCGPHPAIMTGGVLA